ncbi:MAG: hypothetical protein Q7R96_02650, partial [Nanoarchaeota archaeon]|nr:hypothetical protein [Nanoarchaeota archaeon]
GQPFPRFLQYCLDISAEYSFLGPEKFKKGRRSFVRKVLARDRLYYTDVFFEQYEEQARKNLELLKDGL